MKHKFISFLFAILMSMAANVAMAYDAEIDGIYYSFDGTEATVTSGDNKYTGDVVIPESVMYNETEYSVVCIGEYAFAWCTEQTSVTIPNSVTSIGIFAFEGCYGLTSITIPNSVTTIGSYAFAWCSGLTSITIPNSVTTIGSHAFAYCSGLTSITIPNSVTCIEDGAFSHCYGLTSIIIPGSVTSIGTCAFYGCSSLTSIKIGNGVTGIGEQAFRYCSSLTSVTIPNSVTSIERSAFQNCNSLTSIVIEEGSTKYDSRDNCNAVIESSSNTLIIGCKNTTIPNSVTSIGNYAFKYCSGLTSITIPNSVTSIGWQAFYYCVDLTSIDVEEGNVIYDSRDNCNAVIESSSNTLIIGCKNTTIPNSVTTIGSDAFFGCSSMTSITIPNSVTTIGSDAFFGCSSLTSITIPSSVTSIFFTAFSGCDSLSTIVVEEGNTMYDSRNNCNAIIVSSSNKLIIGCKNSTIPNSVSNIGFSAFRGCSGLTSITIPNSVMTIEWGAFDDCSSLTDVYCYAETVPTTGDNVFFNTPIDNAILHVPSGSIDAYKTTAPWSNFKEIVESDYLNVADLNIKSRESDVQEISLNNGLTNLVAFQMDLTLPEGVGIDKVGCALSSRITDEEQELTIGKLESGAYRITSASLSLAPISGNDGTLLTLKLTAENGCIGGQATISNIIFSTAESEKVIVSDKAFDIGIIYKVVYKVDGEAYQTDEYVYNAPLTLIDEPTKEGYTFGGWSELPETMPNHDVIVTGNFSVNKYKLTYTVDGEEYKTYEVEYGATITPEAEPTKEGYTFSGWSEIPETMPAHDVTVTGSFSINKYKLTYTVDGDEYKTYEIEYGATITPETEPTKEGYTFSGWSEIPETMPAHDVTIYGTFTINTYKLTYMIDDAVYKVVDYKYGEAITPEPQPEGNYVSFEWVGLPEAMPAKDVTVYASYVTGISDVVLKENIVRIYSPNGKVLDKLQKGLNIVLMKDGTIKKIVVK